MELTTDHKVQIFCAALSATIQADAAARVAAGSNSGSGIGSPTLVQKAGAMASEAIALLLSKDWS